MAEACIALFFRAGEPHRLSPTSILVITNYGPGIGRTIRHRGFEASPMAMRQLTAAEQQQQDIYRFRLLFYDDWASLVRDEEQLLADSPELAGATRFLATCRECAQDPAYTPRVKPGPVKAGFVPQPELEEPFTAQELAQARQTTFPFPNIR